MQNATSTPGELVVTPEERAAQQLAPPRRRTAKILLELNGYVILRQAAGPDSIAAAAAAFAEVWRDTLDAELGEDAPPRRTPHASAFAWLRKRRYRIFPALSPAFADPWIALNPFAVPLLEALLGPDFYCKFISSDTCCDGSVFQAPHRDCAPSDSKSTDLLCVNVPLMDCGLHNGPLELWPGTHLWKNFLEHHLVWAVQDGRNRGMDELVTHLRSVKVELRPGDVLVRNPGTWHRGTPNPLPQPRTMMIGVYGSRRVKICPYGSPYFNVDRTVYESLSPPLGKRFAYAFESADPLYAELAEARADASEQGVRL
jgi:ectoine hydroxylase-related dioxygenase (phytanoyl-CoA dioxygenase family)